MLLAAMLALLVSGAGEGAATPRPGPYLLVPPIAEAPGEAVIGDPLAGMAPHRAHRIRDRIADPAGACLAAGDIDRASPEKAELSRLFEVLSASRTGALLLRQAARRGVLVCIDGTTRNFAYYIAPLRFIGVRAGQSEGRKIAFLAHELAHVPQHPVYSDNRYYPPQDLMLLRRIREATASATATCITWQLRQQGHPEAWLDKQRSAFGDLIDVFAQAMGAETGRGAELRATRAVFDHWFENPRRLDFYDRMTLDHLDRISRDYLGLVAPRRQLTHGFLIAIGALDGENFLDQAPYRMLTGAHYRRSLSPGNAAQLDSILQNAVAPDPRGDDPPEES
jgi:hypothetical protein